MCRLQRDLHCVYLHLPNLFIYPIQTCTCMENIVLRTQIFILTILWCSGYGQTNIYHLNHHHHPLDFFSFRSLFDKEKHRIVSLVKFGILIEHDLMIFARIKKDEERVVIWTFWSKTRTVGRLFIRWQMRCCCCFLFSLFVPCNHY